MTFILTWELCFYHSDDDSYVSGLGYFSFAGNLNIQAPFYLKPIYVAITHTTWDLRGVWSMQEARLAEQW